MSAGLLPNPFYRILSGFISVDYAAKAFFARPCARLYSLKRKDSVDQTWPATFFITTTKVCAHDKKTLRS